MESFPAASQQQQQLLRFPSQSPIRRPKRRRNLYSPLHNHHHHYGSYQPWVPASGTICLRYYPLWMTVAVSIFFFLSWSKLLQTRLDHEEHSLLLFHSNSADWKRRFVFRDGQQPPASSRRSGSAFKSHYSNESQHPGSQPQFSTTTLSSNHTSLQSPLLFGWNTTQQQQQQQQQQRQSYVSSLFPVLPRRGYHPSSRYPVSVHMIVGATPISLDSATNTLATGWFLDGFEQSRYLQVVAVTYYHNPRHVWTAELVDSTKQAKEAGSFSTVSNHTAISTTTPPLVWAVDWSSMQQDCHALLRVLQSVATAKATAITSHQYILLLDSSGSVRQDVPCHSLLLKFVGNDRKKIRLAKRSIVQQRYWMDQEQWVHVGEIVPQLPFDKKTNDEQGDSIVATPVLHMPLVIRDDIVELLYNLTAPKTQPPERLDTRRASHHLRHHRGSSQQPRFLEYPFPVKRLADVTFFWRKGDYSHYGKLRRKVSNIVQSLDKVYLGGGQRIRTLVRIFGDEDGIEAGVTQLEYVQQLLRSKIVVVAQRDEWEDQYGLLEAMACGAMVMTDVMLSLPSMGLVNGKHVVLYDSDKSLRELILYYLHPKHEQKRLAIAKRGWQVAMERHRSWHRIEEMIFGKPLTAVTAPFEVTSPALKRQFGFGSKISADATKDH